MKRYITSFKKAVSEIMMLILVFTLLPVRSAAADNDAYAVIACASDFQAGSLAAFSKFTQYLSMAKNDGIDTPDGVILGGDYSIPVDTAPEVGVNRAKKALVSAYPSMDTDRITVVQGNHDLSGKSITPTGLCDMGSYYVYVLNEDSYPCGQNSSGSNEVINLANQMKTDFNGIIKSEKIKPVFVASHVPLHHSKRLSYGDCLYSKYVFDVLNEFGKKLDIVFLFGHNHTGNFDDYIGGSLNFIEKGGNIRIPVPDAASQGENGFTSEKLTFTYMNYGYVGDVKNSSNETSVNVNAVSIIELCPESIRILRYGAQGKIRSDSIARINRLSTEREIRADGTARIDYGSNLITGIKEDAKSLDKFIKVTKSGCSMQYGEIKTGAKLRVIKSGTVIEEYTIVMLGDTDGNGAYNSADALNVLQHSTGEKVLVGKNCTAGDVNRDGNINSSDALLILQYSVGQINTLTGE